MHDCSLKWKAPGLGTPTISDGMRTARGGINFISFKKRITGFLHKYNLHVNTKNQIKCKKMMVYF